MSTKPVRAWSVSVLCAVALVSANCSKNSSPTSPDSGGQAPGPQTPGGTNAVQVTINPNPVPFSGVPVTDTPDCATKKNTWYYDQVFTEMSGNGVTFTNRVDFFDGFAVNNFGINYNIPARASSTLKARWCSGNATAHTAQSTFNGVDSKGAAVSLTTPVIRLMAP